MNQPLFWILDDLTALHQVNDDVAGKSATLLQPRATQRILDSIDKQLIGQFAAKIRTLRKVEPYKGKGIKFVGEQIRRKAGKTAAK